MRMKQWITGFAVGWVVAAGAYATNPAREMKEQIQVPQCLAAKLNPDYKVLAENKAFKILEIPSNELQSIALLADKAACGRFVNVTHHVQRVEPTRQTKMLQRLIAPKPALFSKTGAKYELKHPEAVEQALDKVVPDNIWGTLTHLTNFYNRSATQDTGVDAAKWVKSNFEHMAKEANRHDTDAYLVETGWMYKQPSVVTVIGKDLKGPGVVIGAHIDTLNGRMPGAGDDGSGSSSVMEVARVLLQSEQNFKHPIYIIWYAAEERGLVGSQYVVEYFKEHNIPVKAAIQFDMTGYRNDPKDSTMWVYQDYTDKALNQFVAELIKTYVKVPVDYSACGYGCSDHASWMDEGIPASFPCETRFEVHNPYIHTEDDDISLISLEHMTNFTKLGLAFAIELASD